MAGWHEHLFIGAQVTMLRCRECMTNRACDLVSVMGIVVMLALVITRAS
jgi:hypothetical protein